jgi:hypothetical protein
MSDVPKPGDRVRVPYGYGEFSRTAEGYVILGPDFGNRRQVMGMVEIDLVEFRQLYDLDEVEIIERNAQPIAPPGEEEFWIRAAQHRDALEAESEAS